MGDNSSIELREYLRRHNPPPNEEYDEFLDQVDVFFKLRVRAEQRFVERPHKAKARQGALPLDWKDIAALVTPDDASPPETVSTQLARECLGVGEEILAALRRVLVREREKVSLGLVQQVDAQCLRWITRQPGRDGVEKAGPRQRILAVVRRENYNTLENRVFKDFLVRAAQETAIYLRKYEGRFPEHDTIQRVKRLRCLCESGLSEPLLERVGEIRELPVPNYVLRQERRYAKIWKAYIELIRQASVAERLWNRRNELAATLDKLRIEAPRQISAHARFHAPIWFNPLDGRHALLESPFYDNEWGKTARQVVTVLPRDDVVVDLAGGSLHYDLLIYGRHQNGKPYIQNYAQPSIEDRNTGNFFFLSELLQKRDAARLKDYLEQLHAILGGKRWFLVVPDDWDAIWQEAVIKAVPLARNQVFLVWRSIAAGIGAVPELDEAEEGEALVILDLLQNGQMHMTRLTLTRAASGEHLVPQRKAVKPRQFDETFKVVALPHTGRARAGAAFLEEKRDGFTFNWEEEVECHAFIKDTKHVIMLSEGHVSVPNSIRQSCCVIDGLPLLLKGMAHFATCLATGQIPYYDELEALSLIVQTEDENVVAKTLVRADEKWPGGRVMETPLLDRAAVLTRGENHVRLLLCMGEVTRDAPLRIKRHDFAYTLEEDHALGLAVSMTPGQGMAVVAVQAGFLRDPIELDFLNGMSDKDSKGNRVTISTIENEMLRSFPPDAPHVIADKTLWGQVSTAVARWMRSRNWMPEGDWFAKAENLYADGTELPEGVTAIERLRRKNVFGNDPEYRYPTGEDFSPLFRKLRDAYDRAAPTSDASSPYAAIIRSIAWTYQSDNPLFKDVRKKCVQRIADYAGHPMLSRPLTQEYTLCANLCANPQEWKTLWNAVSTRLQGTSNGNNVEEELRLLYNLLQFHPTFLRDTKLNVGVACWQMMDKLLYWYSRYNEGGYSGSRRIGYVLKCMLYLLRCRKFDGKVFATRNRNRYAYDILWKCLRKRPEAETKWGLHSVVCDYLDGKGTIAGLPAD